MSIIPEGRTLVQPAPFTRAWITYFSSIGIVLVILMLAAVVGITRDSAQDKTTRALLGCFNEYAVANNSTGQAVRDASVVVADKQRKADQADSTETLASAARNQALAEVLVFLLSGSTDAEQGVVLGQRLTETNAVLIKAQQEQIPLQADLVAAQAALAKARKDNPVPEPPDTFCDVDM